MSIAVLSVFSVLSNYVRDKRDKCNSRIGVAKQQGSVMWSVIHGCHRSGRRSGHRLPSKRVGSATTATL
jgi:hypothetical protein